MHFILTSWVIETRLCVCVWSCIRVCDVSLISRKSRLSPAKRRPGYAPCTPMSQWYHPFFFLFFLRMISKDCSIRSASEPSGCRTRHPNYRAASQLNSQKQGQDLIFIMRCLVDVAAAHVHFKYRSIRLLSSCPQSIRSQSQLMSLLLSDKLVPQYGCFNCPCPSRPLQSELFLFCFFFFLSLDSLSLTSWWVDPRWSAVLYSTINQMLNLSPHVYPDWGWWADKRSCADSSCLKMLKWFLILHLSVKKK